MDGIYPKLLQFVKAINIPIGQNKQKFTNWQFAAHKSVERAFGVLQNKFNRLVQPSEYWFMEEIHSIVLACITLHNMMVKEQIDNNEIEDVNFYADIVPNAPTGLLRTVVDAETRVDKVASLTALYYKMYGPSLARQFINTCVFTNASRTLSSSSLMACSNFFCLRVCSNNSISSC